MNIAQLGVFLVFQYLASIRRSDLFDGAICTGAYNNNSVVTDFEKQAFLWIYSVFVTYICYAAVSDSAFPDSICMHIAHFGLILIMQLFKAQLCPLSVLLDSANLIRIVVVTILYSLCLFNPTKPSLKILYAAALAYIYLYLY